MITGTAHHPHPVSSPARRPRRRGSVDWRVVAAASTIMMVEGYDLGIYGMLLPIMLSDPSIALSTSAAGLAGSAAFIGMLLGGLAVGMLCARYGQRRILIGGILLFSAAMLAAAAAPNVLVLWITRLLAGCGLGVVMPICMAAVRASCSRVAIPLCFSLVTGGIPAGGALAALASRAAALQIGWRPLFGGGALLGMVLLPVLGVVLRAGRSRGAEQPATSRTVPWRDLILPALAGSLATFCFLLSFYGLMTWLTKLMTQLQVPIAGAFQLTLLLNLGAVVGSGLTGLAATRFGPLPLTVISGLVGAACLVLVPSRLVGAGTMIVVVVILGMASPSPQNLVNALVAEATEAPWRTGLLGFTLGVGRLGAVAAPVIGSHLLISTVPGIGLTRAPGVVFLAFATASMGGVIAACWLATLVARRHRAGTVNSPA